ncbi:uncharacterized protein [Dermacentor albipictus]|uniref:uncharacterized protein n=1 Tax=Dermacentor albipictus TaxID=60249 RepID=UPI0038FD1C6C
MENHGGKDTAQEHSTAEISEQVAVSGPASAGPTTSHSAEKVHKKHSKKRTKSADVHHDGGNGRYVEPSFMAPGDDNSTTPAPTPAATSTTYITIPARRDPGAFSGKDGEDIDDWISLHEHVSRNNRSPESAADSSYGRGKKAKREPKAKGSDATPAPPSSHDTSPEPLPPPVALVEKPAAPSAAVAPDVHGAPTPVDHEMYPPAQDVPELPGFDNSLPTIEQKRPKMSIILAMIASAGIMCLMLVVIVSMLLSIRRRAKATCTNTARPATMIHDGVEMAATSPTTTITTGSENATSSHSHNPVVEQT